MTVAGALPGAARLVLAYGVAYLDPAPAVFEAMLDGWAVQQRCRLLKPGTVSSRLDLVRRVKEFSNQYPWQWQPAEVEAFFDHLLAGQRPIRESTARNYQNALRLFCDYITDARYGWPATCVERFGQAPTRVLHEWNSVVHVAEYEGQPGRRPLTYDEVQKLFDAADAVAWPDGYTSRASAPAAFWTNGFGVCSPVPTARSASSFNHWQTSSSRRATRAASSTGCAAAPTPRS